MCIWSKIGKVVSYWQWSRSSSLPSSATFCIRSSWDKFKSRPRYAIPMWSRSTMPAQMPRSTTFIWNMGKPISWAYSGRPARFQSNKAGSIWGILWQVLGLFTRRGLSTETLSQTTLLSQMERARSRTLAGQSGQEWPDFWGWGALQATARPRSWRWRSIRRKQIAGPWECWRTSWLRVPSMTTSFRMAFWIQRWSTTKTWRCQ